MDYFTTESGEAFCESVPLAGIAENLGTPVYVYSRAALNENCQIIKEAFSTYPTLPYYSIKANHNLSVLKEIFSCGFGAEVVSVGELGKAMAAGAKAEDIVFSGVGKTRTEIKRALRLEISSHNVESFFELELINELAAELEIKAPICLRINPDIDAKTHPDIATGLYETKFGIAESNLEAALKYILASKNLTLVGISCHIGSQITDLKPFDEAAERMAEHATNLKSLGFPLTMINMGGGLGIRYHDERPPTFNVYAQVLIHRIAPTGLKLVIELGRSLVGNAGVLVTEVLGVKNTPTKNFVVVDAGMNDLMRPTLYNAYHEILLARKPKKRLEVMKADIVGPICETGDTLGKDRELPVLRTGELLYIQSCGAYAATMASNYNCRPRAMEVMVDGNTFDIIRHREKTEDLWQDELELLSK